MESSSNKTLAKNTIFLYLRTLLTMCISLYTSRVFLDALGITDYGIYNVIGGFVAMFAIITGALSASISRFVTFEIGKKNGSRINEVFCTSINIQVVLIVIVFIVGELIGPWFIDKHLNIPVERIIAAKWIFQCSLFSFAFNLLSVPYNACLIAHEKMKVFAYISILEAVLKLIICYALIVINYDRLIVYSILLLLVSIIIRFIYSIYCSRQFSECKYRKNYDIPLFLDMLKFSGWSFLTNCAYIFNTQGVNILINLFFGVSVNAARGIATQVESAIMKFANDFSTAINPQIIKSYAVGDYKSMLQLVYRGAKISYFLLLFLSLPVILETDFILCFWLKDVPEHTSILFQLCMIGVMIDRIGCTTTIACMATGKIKNYTIWVSIVACFVFPLTWLCFQMGMPVESTYMMYILVYLGVDIVRMIMMRMLIDFSIREYLYEIYVVSMVATLAAIILPLAVTHYLEPSVTRFFITCLVCILSCILSILFIGFKSNERKLFFKFLSNKFHI